MKTLEERVAVFEVDSVFQKAYPFEVYDVAKAATLFKTFRPALYIIVALYLTGIYFGKQWMKNRPAYKLKYPLFFWNVGLAVFSMICTVRAYPQAVYLLSQPNGIYRTFCQLEVFNYATAYWGLLFVLSKIVELGDTAFIVLRKQKLIFLHWYHHASVLVLSWLAYEQIDTSSQVYVLNTFVHSFMYTYYALRALQVKIPKRIAMAITTIQITQFLIGFYVGIPTIKWMVQGVDCDRHPEFTYVMLVVGISYLALFINFFVQAYIVGGKKQKTK